MGEERRLQVMQWLLSEAGPYPAKELLLARNNNGSTALHVAAYFGQQLIMKALLKAAADAGCSKEVANAVTQSGGTFHWQKPSWEAPCCFYAPSRAQYLSGLKSILWIYRQNSVLA